MTDRQRATTIRTSAGVLLVLVVAALGLVLAASHTTPTGYHADPHGGRYTISAAPSRSGSTPSPTSSSSARHDPKAGKLVSIGVGLIVVEVAALVAGVVLATRWITQRRRRPRAAGEPDTADAQLLAVHLAVAADEGLEQLQYGAVDEAIVDCWLRLRDAAVATGIAARVADSPSEFATRIEATTAVRAEPLQRLAELYREARFSGHAMTEPARTDAVRALLAVRADLLHGTEPAHG